MSDQVEERLLGWAEEALELRHGASNDPEGPLRFPSYEEGPQAFMQVLIRARARSDRIEELLSKATHVKASLVRKQLMAKFEAERAYDEAAVRRANTRTQEFSSSKERNAEATIDSLLQKRQAVLAERLTMVAQEATEVISQTHWGLNGFRTDLREVLHSFQHESGLER